MTAEPRAVLRWFAKLRAGSPGNRAPPPGSARPPGPLVWIHAPQLGTEGAVLALADALEAAHGGLTILLTGSARGAGAPDAPWLLRAAAPADTASSTRAFFESWQPDVAVIFSPDPPAALINTAAHRAIPLSLICVSPQRQLSRRLLRRFRHIFVTAPDKLRHLAKHRRDGSGVEVIGELSVVHAPPGCNPVERENFARLLAGRPCWLAVGTSTAEDVTVVAAQAAATRLAHRLLLILVPREPARAPGLAKELRRRGWQVALRSADEEPEEETQIFIADTEGESGLWLRLAPVSFLGGSLDMQGSEGVDPAAPAALGSAILHGPNPGANVALFARLDAADAARTVRDAPSLARALTALIAPDAAAELAHNAWDVCTAGAQTTDRIVTCVMADLDGPEGG